MGTYPTSFTVIVIYINLTIFLEDSSVRTNYITT